MNYETGDELFYDILFSKVAMVEESQLQLNNIHTTTLKVNGSVALIRTITKDGVTFELIDQDVKSKI